MNESKMWERFDIAKNCISLLIGHYSALIFEEEQKPVADAARVAFLEAEQDKIIDVQDSILLTVSVKDQAAIEQIITTYQPILRAELDAAKARKDG